MNYPPSEPAFPDAEVLEGVHANIMRPMRELKRTDRLHALNPTMFLTGTWGYVVDSGTLWITEAGLDFQPIDTSFVTERTGIALAEIADIRRSRFLFRVGFDVDLVDGARVSFVCWDRGRAILAVRKAGMPFEIATPTRDPLEHLP